MAGRVFVDANGNLQPFSSTAPASSQPLRSADVERGNQRGGIRTMADMAPAPGSDGAAQAGPQGGFCDNLKAILKQFHFKSAPGILVALQLFFYFFSLWIVTPRAVITPDTLSLWKIGSSNYQMERCVTSAGGKFIVELRRLIVPIFLHTGFMHILFNVVFQVFSCPRALAYYGPHRFLVLFLVSGICGNLLSGAAEHIGVGASTSCYGVIGAFIVQAVVMWNQMDDPEWRNYTRNMLLLNCGMLVIWEIINWKTLDHFGHLGGLLSGLCLGVILAPEGMSVFRSRVASGLLALGIFICMLKIFGVEAPIDCEMAWLNYSSY